MICSRCKHDKDISNFWKKTGSKTGYNTWCKECCRDSARVSNKTPKDKLISKIRSATITENKLLKKENKKICIKCKEIFELKNPNNIRCPKCESIRGKEYRLKIKEANNDKL